MACTLKLPVVPSASPDIMPACRSCHGPKHTSFPSSPLHSLPAHPDDFFMKVMQYVLYEQCGLAAPAGGSKASRLGAAHADIIRQILPPGGLRLLIFLDGDVYIR